MDYLTDAELQFRLACGLAVTNAAGDLHVDYPATWSYGPHVVVRTEMEVPVEELERACAALVHSATYLLAVEIFSAFGERLPTDADPQLINAYEIARLSDMRLLTSHSSRSGASIPSAARFASSKSPTSSGSTLRRSTARGFASCTSVVL